jgi:hypothetical protein
MRSIMTLPNSVTDSVNVSWTGELKPPTLGDDSTA